MDSQEKVQYADFPLRILKAEFMAEKKTAHGPNKSQSAHCNELRAKVNAAKADLEKKKKSGATPTQIRGAVEKLLTLASELARDCTDADKWTGR